MKVLIAQMDPLVGGFERNYQKMKSILTKATDVDLVVFPECSICGYPPQDLLDYPEFAVRSECYANKIIEEISDRAFIFGSIERNKGAGKPHFNVALFADQGRMVGRYKKCLLPTYDVFDEDRFIEPGSKPCIVDFRGEKVGITICEDIWSENVGTVLHNRYSRRPLDEAKEASLFVNLSASPFEYAKVKKKRTMLQKIATRYRRPLIYVNSVGANDSLIFDGRSYFWSEEGELQVSAKAFEEDYCIVDTQKRHSKSSSIPLKDDEQQNIQDALVLGIRDYFDKLNFHSAIIGLSGGIDSAVVACLAAKALGAHNLLLVHMPSIYTSQESTEDSRALAASLGSEFIEISIESAFNQCVEDLKTPFQGRGVDITEENLQARIRGMFLMALSNKRGGLVLATGNKSELAVGYSTLYGDMTGALAPLADLYKSQVYALGGLFGSMIPKRIFDKAPSAELRENQKDQDSLPPYSRLDEMLRKTIEHFYCSEDLMREGYDKAEVEQILGLIAFSEHKRYQMPLGLKVSSKAFGIGRRMPLVHHFFGSEK